MKIDEILSITMVSCVVIYLIVYTIFLVKHGKDQSSFEIFLAYTGGTIGVVIFSPLVLIGIIIAIPVGLLYLIRGK